MWSHFYPLHSDGRGRRDAPSGMGHQEAGPIRVRVGARTPPIHSQNAGATPRRMGGCGVSVRRMPDVTRSATSTCPLSTPRERRPHEWEFAEVMPADRLNGHTQSTEDGFFHSGIVDCSDRCAIRLTRSYA